MFEIPPIDGKSGWILMDPICPLQEFESGQLEKQLRRLERKIAAPRMRRLEDGDWVKLWDWILMDIYIDT